MEKTSPDNSNSSAVSGTSGQALMHYAINLLARRRYTINDMRKKLATRAEKYNAGSPSDVERIIARLSELKYLNDGEYAVLFVEDQLRRAPQGLLMLRKRLKAKGLMSEEIESALQKTEIDEYTMACKALRKKQRMLTGQDQRKLTEKLYRFLMSRGFSPSVSIKAIEENAAQTTLV